MQWLALEGSPWPVVSCSAVSSKTTAFGISLAAHFPQSNSEQVHFCSAGLSLGALQTTYGKVSCAKTALTQEHTRIIGNCLAVGCTWDSLSLQGVESIAVVWCAHPGSVSGLCSCHCPLAWAHPCCALQQRARHQGELQRGGKACKCCLVV